MSFYDGIPVPVSVRISRDAERLVAQGRPCAINDRLRHLCAAAVAAHREGQVWLIEDALAFARAHDGTRFSGIRKTFRAGSEGVAFLDDLRNPHGVSLAGMIRGIIEVSAPLIPPNAWEPECERA